MSEVAGVAPDIVRRADANYRELFRTMARLSPYGAVEEDGELLLVRTGPLLPMFNAAHVLQVPVEPETVIARARSFYARFDQGWALTTADAATDAMAGVATAAGLTPHPSPGMVLAPLAGPPTAVPGLTVERVRDPATLRVYNDTMTAGFGGVWAAGAILDGRSLLDEPGLTHYVGYLGGVPVATAMRFVSHQIAGVFNVSTAPAYRRRGVGEAVTWRAALDGRDEGCIASALQASDMGEPVYRRMGYRTVTTFTVWLPPGEGA